jgi:hypothetical protein
MPLALLAHLELPSMDSTESRDFFIAGLGAVVSSLTGLQINIGATQIHLRPSIDSHWPGWLECWSTEPLTDIQARIQQSTLLPDVSGQARLSCEYSGDGRTRVQVQRAPEGITHDTEGAHPGGSGTLITLTRAVYHVHSRLLRPLHEFFSSALLLQPGELELSDGSCVVWFNSGQQLVFAEADPSSLEPQPDADDRGAGSDGGRLTVAVFVDSVRGFRDTWEAAMRHCGSSGGTDGAEGSSTWEAVSTSGAFRVRTPLALLDLEVRSLAHAECPLPRRDLVAAAVPVPTAPAFANWPPLPPLPFEHRGIPRSTGNFGESAREIALASRRSNRSKRAAEEDADEDQARPAQAPRRDGW